MAQATKLKWPMVTRVATPSHCLSRQGCFCTKGSSLNYQGAGEPLRCFSYTSERSCSSTWSHHRHTESCKQNKTKQNIMQPCECSQPLPYLLWGCIAQYQYMAGHLGTLYFGSITVCHSPGMQACDERGGSRSWDNKTANLNVISMTE